MRPLDRPRLVDAVVAEGVRRRPGLLRLVGGDVPVVPFELHVGLDGVLELFDPLHGRRVRWPRQHDVGVEIRLARLGRGERAAVCPDRDEVVTQDVAEPVTQAQPGRAGRLGDLI